MPQRLSFFASLSGAMFVLLIASCSGAPRLYTVSGTVTYQGKPIPLGQIVFADAAGNSPASAGAIEQGSYTLETTPGAKSVRITATKETGKMIEGAMGAEYPEVIDLLPEQYNSATTLQANIAPDRPLVVDFALE